MEDIVNDLKEQVRELKEDKKRDRELIDYLKDRLMKAEQQGKDDDLHRKIDRLLQNLETSTKCYGEITEKIEALKAEMKTEISNCKEMEKISGTVEMFDELQVKIVEMQADFLTKLKDVSRPNAANNGSIPQELEKLAETLTSTQESLTYLNKNYTLHHKELEVLKAEMKLDPKERKPDLKCCSCKAILPRGISLRDDGVTVTCPDSKCNAINLIAEKYEGHRWMRFYYCHHCVLLTDDVASEFKRNLSKLAECNTCGTSNTLTDTYSMRAFPDLKY